MKVNDFNYSYPEELVAQAPLPERDASKMMLLSRAQKTFAHHHVRELAAFLREGDVLVLNNTKVAPVRLFGTRGGREKIELLVVEPSDTANVWRCLIKKAKNIRPGEKFFFGMQATAIAKGREDIYLLVEFRSNALKLAMNNHGVPPLPPYIKRTEKDAYTEADFERYQTTFAEKFGSAAAPTAGLHLSQNLLAEIKQKGVEVCTITLHVGIDTFAPVRVDTLEEHKMHGEKISISSETAELITRAKHEGRRIIAVGTTTTRALESAWEDNKLRDGQWTTNIFITPGYEFKVIDGLLTNFHQPKSTLIMMVSALVGKDFLFKCYEEAIKQDYRLFSFGDCMLIV
ncbi:MAG: tRNA preQ1(34) S-adenosylmethionine ribosyltransferase-isomerase QueA [Deltaproteobacteria bacterium CG11_big_fil_rev_8_21_14_0_20_42_23]|nr:MAG: tRNA preQ1(34) S-adenosylmethionine ribosyltransferase-isomerase QueA [Deltaproteobacteria bacterium CG11_big_fil_rev_8_21_14_0_20_42_23]PJC63590.1 MAG: tRNA preQ1(34) S-adenosylmethionine ribosyltransferase-isomerase QueA [Deltaproteobacteria bacterium CG_4_9_14_0_2_um_filter_42_21]